MAASSAVSPSKRVERTYSTDMRDLCIDLMCAADDDESLPQLAAADLARFASAPPASTLRTWRLHRDTPPPAPQQRGVEGTLTTDELSVVGGYALYLLERRRVVDHHCIIDFVGSAYTEPVSQSWVSKHMHKLGFSSHRPRGLSWKYYNADALPIAIDFVNDTRPTLIEFGDTSRIVAMDQISFWSNGLVTSSYAPIGR
jgi:hypothetical protein